MEGTMRNKLIVFLAAALFILAGAALFEAKAMVGGGTANLAVEAKSFSPVETMDCNAQGWFCPVGKTLQCNPLCTCQACTPAHALRHVKHKG
jgi:hypothetical protein